MSSLYLVCNRGKRSIAVDIQTPEGVDVVRRLAAESDVMVQNFRPGVIDRLGLGYEHVREVQPDVVYASLSGFGTAVRTAIAAPTTPSCRRTAASR